MAAARDWSTMRQLHDPQRLRWLQTAVSNLAITTFRRNGALGDRLPRLEAIYRPGPADTHMDAVSAIAPPDGIIITEASTSRRQRGLVI